MKTTKAYTLSTYIYPLKEKLLISDSLGYELDNPRSQDEVDFVLNYIRPAIEKFTGGEEAAGLRKVRWQLVLARIERENRGRDGFFIQSLRGEPDEVLAKNWIIVRYDDKGEFNNLRRSLNRFIDLGTSDEGDAFLSNYYQLESYGHLLQLLIVDTKEYYGQPLTLLSSPYAMFEATDTEHMRQVAMSIFRFERNIESEPGDFGYSWAYFPHAREKLLQGGKLLDGVFSGSKLKLKKETSKSKDVPKGRMLYVGDLLRITDSQSYDLKVKFILLVSILELLVTHAPDMLKNVEDSIRKQFILKLTILLHQHEPQMDLDGQKKKLSNIYDIRSKIAHGGELSAGNKVLVELVKDLFYYVNLVFNVYVKDPAFIEFLKAN